MRQLVAATSPETLRWNLLGLRLPERSAINSLIHAGGDRVSGLMAMMTDKHGNLSNGEEARVPPWLADLLVRLALSDLAISQSAARVEDLKSKAQRSFKGGVFDGPVKQASRKFIDHWIRKESTGLRGEAAPSNDEAFLEGAFLSDLQKKSDYLVSEITARLKNQIDRDWSDRVLWFIRP